MLTRRIVVWICVSIDEDEEDRGLVRMKGPSIDLSIAIFSTKREQVTSTQRVLRAHLLLGGSMGRVAPSTPPIPTSPPRPTTATGRAERPQRRSELRISKTGSMRFGGCTGGGTWVEDKDSVVFFFFLIYRSQ